MSSVMPDANEVLRRICTGARVDEWGVAANPGWALAPDLPFAVSLVGRHAPAALAGLEADHMSQAFFDDYARLFGELDAAAAGLVREAERLGHRAVQTSNVMAGPHDDPPLEDWGDAGVFAHKAAATQAGLGWVGKTALFVSSRFGPAVRLTTVLTDLPLTAGDPVTESRCGDCRQCVDACTQGAGKDVPWRSGMTRDELYDEKACETKTWEHPEWAAPAASARPSARTRSGRRARCRGARRPPETAYKDPSDHHESRGVKRCAGRTASVC